MCYFRFFLAFLLLITCVSARLESTSPDSGVPAPSERDSQLSSTPVTTRGPTVTPTSQSISPEESLAAFSSSWLAAFSSGLDSDSASSSPSATLPTVPSSLAATPSLASKTEAIVAVVSTSTAPTPTTSATLLTSSPETSNKTLAIALSVVFGSLGLLAIFAAVLFIRRCRRSPAYRQGGITPIDDEEIERWRGRKETYAEASSPDSHHRKTSSTVVMTRPPGLTWDFGPTLDGPNANGDAALSPPPIAARAPNARSGLTDAAVPSAYPFVAPVRRPSTRLSKHGRNQSRKSSFTLSLAERPSVEQSRPKNSLQAERRNTSPRALSFDIPRRTTSTGPVPPSPGRVAGPRTADADADLEIGMAS